jgi:hypothetical protein
MIPAQRRKQTLQPYGGCLGVPHVVVHLSHASQQLRTIGLRVFEEVLPQLDLALLPIPGVQNIM